MTESQRISVIVLNRDRVKELGRTLIALTHQTFRHFEVIVVSNQLEVLAARYPLMERVVQVSYEPANISGARNAGIAASQGEIIAFCDDDAVPEPRWLERLVGGFVRDDIGAVGGLVRGRNGISIQWGPQEVDCFGNDWPVVLEPDVPVHKGPSRADRVLKTVGTNCAFQRSALEAINGFDEAYHFFLDETDVNFRLAAAGWAIGIVPSAEVHHGYARSAYRTSERMPISLTEIGASKAYFCGLYGEASHILEELHGFRQAQRNRLVRGMQLGLIEPGQVRAILESLETGFIKGARRRQSLRALERSNETWRVYCESSDPPEMILVTANFFNRRKKRREAAALAASGACVTLIELNDTAQMLTVRFSDDGYWWHRGGVFGRADRAEPIVRLRRRLDRIETEIARIHSQRTLFE